MSLYLHEGSYHSWFDTQSSTTNRIIEATDTVPSEKLPFWVWLHELRGISLQRKKRLLTAYGDPQVIFDLSEEELFGKDAKINTLDKHNIRQKCKNQRVKQLARAHTLLDIGSSFDIEILTCVDYRYRQTMREDSQSPILFYYRGTMVSPIRPLVYLAVETMVNPVMKNSIGSVCRYYGEIGYCIAFALTFGSGPNTLLEILRNSTSVFAIASGGLDCCYPIEQWPLFERILDQGVILSKHALGVVPTTKRGVLRNRLLSLWADEIVIDEETNNSLQCARHYDKPIYTLHPLQRLSNEKEPTQVGETPLQLYRMDGSPKVKNNCPYHPFIGREEEHLITVVYDMLRFSPLATREIADALAIGDSKALLLLNYLENSGYIQQISNSRWSCR